MAVGGLAERAKEEAENDLAKLGERYVAAVGLAFTAVRGSMVRIRGDGDGERIRNFVRRPFGNRISSCFVTKYC